MTQEQLPRPSSTPSSLPAFGGYADLYAAVKSAGFTPPLRELPALLELLSSAEAEVAEPTALAIRRMGLAVLPALLTALPASQRPRRGRLTELVGRLAAVAPPEQQGPAQAMLAALLDDADLKTQLNAATALGRLRGPVSEAALLNSLAQAPRRELRLALVRALGKVGGQAAQAALVKAAAAAATDQATARVADRAQLILQREQSRQQSAVIALAAPFDRPRPLWLHCRPGLEALLIEEASACGFKGATSPAAGCVELPGVSSLEKLWQLRLAVDAGIPLAPTTGPVSAGVVKALSEAQGLLRRLTALREVQDGSGSAAASAAPAVVRYRISWPEATKAQLWALAGELMAACPTLVNDPTRSTWDLRVHTAGGATQVELKPKSLVDPRFYYRQGFVPAASHPTIAAALARLAKVQPSDVVWDPFVGSGSELIECGLQGAVHGLYGTDSDPAAIAIARGNLAAAALSSPVVLHCMDFAEFKLERPTLIVTNPPMGRRVQRGQLGEVLDRFVEHAAELLAPGGRLVWLTPLPARTNPQFAARGFRLAYQQMVDMGGFPAELQRLEKAL